jgi:hypothetical protein
VKYFTLFVAQTSKSAVSRISKSAGFPQFPSPADLEVGDTAGLETCATLTERKVFDALSSKWMIG